MKYNIRMEAFANLITNPNIVEGGGVLIALSLVWVIYKLLTNHDRHLQSVVDRNTDAWMENAKALSQLTVALGKDKKRK